MLEWIYFSRKVKLLKKKKFEKVILKIDNNRGIKYNYL